MAAGRGGLSRSSPGGTRGKVPPRWPGSAKLILWMASSKSSIKNIGQGKAEVKAVQNRLRKHTGTWFTPWVPGSRPSGRPTASLQGDCQAAQKTAMITKARGAEIWSRLGVLGMNLSTAIKRICPGRQIRLGNKSRKTFSGDPISWNRPGGVKFPGPECKERFSWSTPRALPLPRP